jgi:hypothetical protein
LQLLGSKVDILKGSILLFQYCILVVLDESIN